MGSTGRTPNVYGIPATLNWCVEAIAQLKGQVFGIVQNGGGGGGGTQDLESVLGYGNTAFNQSIILEGNDYSQITISGTPDNSYVEIISPDNTNGLFLFVNDSSNYIRFFTQGAEFGLKLEPEGPVTSNKTVEIPIRSGTILLDDLLEQPNGIATLDGSGVVPNTQLPYSLLDYKGSWVVNSSPVLANGAGAVGDIYIVSAGGTALGETWVVGNMAIYNGSVWEKIGAVVTATVTSVSSADNIWATVANSTTTPVITIVSAPKLTTARDINNIEFDGTDDILLNSTYNNQSGTTYTFVLTDNQKIVTATNASPQTYTVPPDTGAGSVAFPIGTRIDVIQLGDGKVTIAPGSGVIINNFPSANRSIAGQYAAVTLLKRDTNTWVLIGNLIA
jgi:hypothetical protein